MNTLTEKVNSNLKILLDLKKDETIKASTGKLIKNDDYVQVDNIVDIEYALYLTFTYLFLVTNKLSYQDCDKVLKDIDRCIDNIYDNTVLSNLINKEDTFKELIYYIDEEYFSLKTRLFHGSPFFSWLTNIYIMMDKITNIFKENNVYISRLFNVNNRLKEEQEEEEEEEKEEEEEEKEEEEEEEEVKEEVKEEEKEDSHWKISFSSSSGIEFG